MIERVEVVSPAEARVLALTEEFSASWRRTVEMAVLLGGALESLKAELGHGNWLPWVEQHFPLGERMARNLMHLAVNRQEIADLPAGTTVTAALEWLKEQQRSARPLPGRIESEAQYEPMLRASIDADTADVVNDILRVCFPDASTALDMTYGSGNFWNSARTVDVVAHDLDPRRALHGAADFASLPYDDDAFDVVVFDPPHLANASQGGVMGDRFGTGSEETVEQSVIAGVLEAWRIGKLGLVVRVTDHVHGQVFVCESDWVRDALDGLIPFEVVHQVRSHAFIDPKWEQPQLSAYNNLSTYLIFRHGDQRHKR